MLAGAGAGGGLGKQGRRSDQGWSIKRLAVFIRVELHQERLPELNQLHVRRRLRR